MINLATFCRAKGYRSSCAPRVMTLLVKLAKSDSLLRRLMLVGEDVPPPLVRNLDAERLGGGQLLVDVLALLQSLLPEDDLRDTLDEEVAELDLGHTETIRVGDIPGSSGGCGVDTSRTTSLKAHLLQHILEVRTSGEERHLDHSTSAKSCTQVRRARQDESQVIVVHEVVSLLLQALLDGFRSVRETREDGGDVGTLLHRHDAELILLIDPDEEVLGIVVVDTTRIRPVASAAGGQEQGGVGLLEQVSVRAELLLLLLGHTGIVAHRSTSVKWIVLSLQLTLESVQTLHAHALGLTTLLERAGRRERESADRSSGTASRGQDVLAIGIDVRLRELGHIHIGDVLGIRSVSTVPLSNDDVEQILERLEAFLVTSDQTAGQDVRMSRVVDTSLDALGQSHATLGGRGFVLLVDLRVLTESDSGQVSMLGEIRKRIRALVTRERGTLLLADVFLVSASELDPFWQLSAGRSNSLRWVGHFRFVEEEKLKTSFRWL